jgi:hypothetical protein
VASNDEITLGGDFCQVKLPEVLVAPLQLSYWFMDWGREQEDFACGKRENRNG